MERLGVLAEAVADRTEELQLMYDHLSYRSMHALMGTSFWIFRFFFRRRIVVVVRSKAINHLHLAVVLMSTVGLLSLFSFILRTRLAYDVSTNLELAS